MELWTPLERWRYGTVLCVGVGALVGGFEAVFLAASSLLSLSFVGAALIGLLAVGLMAIVGGLFGLVTGFPVQLIHREETRPSTTIARQVALCATLLVGFYLWQRAWTLAAEGAPPVAWGALAAMPLGFTGVAYLNARFWLRKKELDRGTTVGFLPIAFGTGALLALGAAASWPLRAPAAAQALEGDGNLVLITVDGLRHDDLALLADDAPSTPNIEALAARGTLFTDAVAPTPHTRSANATILVGLHPLRLRVLDDADPLSRGYQSLFEALLEEGWATAGFVSAAPVASGSGLEQGFRAYDDDFTPGPSGLGALMLGRDVLAVAAWLGAPTPWRPADDTAQRAATWIRRNGDAPFAVWVHLADPLRADAPEAAVARVDDAVGAVLDAVEEAGASERTALLLVGSHGALRGAHGGEGNRTLYDEVLRVPLIIAAPEPPVVSRVDAQIRTMDVASTATVLMGLDPLPNSEGIALNEYASGKRSHTIWTPLVGQDLDGTWLVGIRNNGVKVFRPKLGEEKMFDLGTDPGEQTDIAGSQEGTLNTARQLLATEQVALDKLLGR